MTAGFVTVGVPVAAVDCATPPDAPGEAAAIAGLEDEADGCPVWDGPDDEAMPVDGTEDALEAGAEDPCETAWGTGSGPGLLVARMGALGGAASGAGLLAAAVAGARTQPISIRPALANPPTRTRTGMSRRRASGVATPPCRNRQSTPRMRNSPFLPHIWGFTIRLLAPPINVGQREGAAGRPGRSIAVFTRS